jgi:tRNA-2-methylthio-N6-dimethylallyladenosine synthase
MNVNDSEKMSHILEQKGHQLTIDDQSADLVIVNSCAVRERAQDKIFSYIGRLLPSQKIIIAGCVAQAEREQIKKRNHRVSYVIGTHQYQTIDFIVEKIFKEQAKGISTGFTKAWQETVPAIYSRDNLITGYISIMEGCNNFCSYCIVPFTRGREKHRPLANIVKEATYLLENGFSEIVLLGQNVNNWVDPKTKLRFHHLLDTLAEQVPVKWIRFITSYPGYYHKELIPVMQKHANIAKHIHFPAQSGSTRILKKMNRIYSRPDYLQMIHQFKQQIPTIKFSSDFIVGFPGETDYDFKLTLSLIEKVEYESIFSFIYSPRKYTKAVVFPDTVSKQKKKDRLYQLQDLQEQIQLRNNKKFINTIMDVLITDHHPKTPGEMIGRTESYRVVNFQSSKNPGQFSRVKINRASPHSLRGEEID